MSRNPNTSTAYDFRMRDSLVGAQMLFVAFGALVLVLLLTGLDPNVALFTADVGTLLFQSLTKRMVPIFLASSFAPIFEAAWFAVPAFVLPEWNLQAVLFIVPVAIAPAIEHFGDILAIGHVTGKDYLKEPGIHRTMMGDGLATSLASFLGSPPNTTYSEVTGAVTLTRMYNPAIMTWAAMFAIVLAFIGKIGAILQTIPVPVMGGIMLLLFGAITVVGLNSLVKAGDDLTEPRNLSIIALILVFGIGGMTFDVGEFSLKGIGLAGIVGVVLNLVLPKGGGVKK